ncbi:MAG: SidA/IucD/PvdA family monooxygenase, partial [Dehalococcoidia bacterium]
TQWFQEQKKLEILPSLVHALTASEESLRKFQATMEEGETIRAANAVLAIGMGYFKNLPPELVQLLPKGRYAHTADLVDFAGLKDRRCLIVGGRQSAFESAALMREAGAAEVHLSYRHETPDFTESDWTWVNGLLEGIIEDPEWFRNLSRAERGEVNRRLWAEGRLKLEPWLAPRLDHESVKMWPRSQITNCQELPSGELEVSLDSGNQLVVDQVLLATGYQVNLDQVPLLTRGNLLPRLETYSGLPVLDRHFQSSIPGLYFTSLPAARDFGPFFGFTVSVRASAKIIGAAIKG